MGAFLRALSSNFSKSLPSRRRQHPTRQRNPPPINRHTRFAYPRLRHPHNRLWCHDPRPQQRSLDRQHPAHRPQNPRRLWGRLEQLNHLWLLQNMLQLAAIPCRLIPRRPHQPSKPTRPNPRARLASTAHADPRRRFPPPQPTGLKPRNQPLDFPANFTQPPIQQHHHHMAQHPAQMPAAHLATQRTQHCRQAQIGGREGGCVHLV